MHMYINDSANCMHHRSSMISYTFPAFPLAASTRPRPCASIYLRIEPRRWATGTAQTTSKKAAFTHAPIHLTTCPFIIQHRAQATLSSQSSSPVNPKPFKTHNVHLRRPRHRRENRPPNSASEGLFPSRPRRRMPASHETIPAMPQDCSRSQLARVSRAEQKLPQLSHGERSDGAGRDEESGLWRGPDCDG